MIKLDFVGIGVQRAATTWTWRQLVQHPDVCQMPKEASNFLPENPDKIQFRQNRDLNYDKCRRKLRGEYTPIYFSSPIARERIRRYSPDAKLLLILRNPVDRIVTQFKVGQWKRFGKIKQNFTDWFLNPRPQDPNPLYIRSPHTANDYARWIKPWLNIFGEQLLVSLYDDVVSDPLGYIKDVYRHIGADESFEPPDYLEREQKDYNFYYERNPFDITKKQRKMLKKHYRGSILDLQDVIARDLSSWLK